MNSETLGEDEGWVAHLYRRRLEFYPICCTLNTKLAATEQSAKHMDIRIAISSEEHHQHCSGTQDRRIQCSVEPVRSTPNHTTS